MPWYVDFYDFLLHWAVATTALFGAAALAVSPLRQPVRKLRVIQWSLVGCLLLATLSVLDIGPRWSLTWPDRQQPTAELLHGATALQESTKAAVLRSRHSPAAPEVRTSADRGLKANSDFAAVRAVRSARQTTDAAAKDRIDLGWLWQLDARLVIVIGYLTGAGMMAAWWLVGVLALRRFLRHAAPADASCRATLEEIAGDKAGGVRLLVSSCAAQPFVCGWRRPAIVVPQRLVEGEAVALRCALAHEWSHITRGDVAWWSLAGVVRLVCFYQPLVWWLRSELRLAQDYLADADAARQTIAAEDYAQFLTQWAARGQRRPLYGGLGILGRRSDLYRRIVMLVQKPQPLDRRCPRRWNVGVAVSLGLVAVAAATYGGDEDQAPPSTQRESSGAPSRTAKSKPTEQPPRAAARSPEQARLGKLVDGVLTRARAIRSGRFAFRRLNQGALSAPFYDLFNDLAEADFVLSLSGDDWAVVRAEKIDGIEYRDNMLHRDSRIMTLRVSRGPEGRAELRIDSPLFVGNVDVLAAVRAGTLPSDAVTSFIDQHRYDVQLSAGEGTQDFPRTTRMEWTVSAADAESVWGKTSDLLSLGGLLRMDVADEDGYVLPRVEFVDRFGGVEARFLADGFVDVAPGIVFPEKYQVSETAEIHYSFHGIELVNQDLPDDDFELRNVPAGTHVRDRRPRKRADGKLVEQGGPLTDFILGAAYGLPKELLAAMDEGVLSDEEAQQLRAPPPRSASTDPAPAGSAPEDSAGVAPKPAGPPKEDLRYGGRSFDEWRFQLLNDLDPNTCITAMDPVAAFGKMGYAGEAVAALAEIMQSDRAVEVGGVVAERAAAALAKIGAPAAHALIEGLADSRPTVRAACAQAIAELGDDGRAASDALEKLFSDKSARVREAAARSFAAVCGEAVLREEFERLPESDDARLRRALVQALNRRAPNANWWVGPCLQLANDDDREVRVAAGAMLANRGPAEKQVIAAVEELMRDDDRVVAGSPVVALAQGDGNNVALLIAVLGDATRSAELWNRFSEGGQVTFAIERLADAREQAAASAPLLAKIADLQVPNWNTQPLAAIDALGKLGPAAEAAIPALERWLARDEISDDDPHKKLARRALEKIRGGADVPPSDQ